MILTQTQRNILRSFTTPTYVTQAAKNIKHSQSTTANHIPVFIKNRLIKNIGKHPASNNRMVIYYQTTKKGLKLLNLVICPKCKTQVPSNVIICWGCGYCLDPHIRMLAAQRRMRNE